jgi:choline dehydrogenase
LSLIQAEGGTAGCVVASRLSEDPTPKVLVIERGNLVDTWASHIPLLSADFNVKTAPVYRWSSTPGLCDLKHGAINMVSGKAMGGTSKVNMSVYHRSIPAELMHGRPLAERVGVGTI